ncbi:MAG TPA: ANTAR domain-containing protein [Jatrophihabitans sp.]|jgi:hypothetical protein
MALIHRRSELRHRAAAELFHAYAIRLMKVMNGSGAEAAASFVAAAAAMVGAQHAAVTFVDGPRELGVLASDQIARTAQEYEFTLGEGPAHDSVMDGPVLVGASGLLRRWPEYGAAVGSLGITSVGAVPLGAHNARLGTLIAFDLRGRSAEQVDLGRVADALVGVLVGDSRGGTADDIAATITEHVDHHALVHRAAGALSEQLHCSVTDALARLRARAFVEGLAPTEIAQRVLDGTARIDD